MRLLMLSWEYPPLVVGGLGRHVEALAQALVQAGHEVQVVTRGDKQQPTDELDHGVLIRRAAADPISIDFSVETLLAWSQASEHALVRAALPLLTQFRPDVIHAHDWLVAQSAATLSAVSLYTGTQSAGTRTPLIVTMHATETGRHQGWLPEQLNRSIHSIERWLARSASGVITCSQAMQDEVGQLFELDTARVHVIPNGVNLAQWRRTATRRTALRAQHDGHRPLVVFAGRLVHEKGVHTLLDAVATLRRQHPGVRLVIAGTGGSEQVLRARARTLRIARNVEWRGFLPADELADLFAIADVAVIPSLYEPFGIVALEAAAAGAPLVMADTGGLSDLIADGVATASFTPDDAGALTAAIAGVLADSAATATAVRRATRVVARDYSWTNVAERTASVYVDALSSRRADGR